MAQKYSDDSLVILNNALYMHTSIPDLAQQYADVLLPHWITRFESMKPVTES